MSACIFFFPGETLSTLLFATRCMSVKTMPVQHAEVDYAEMCAALQAKVNEMEGVTTQRLLEQQEAFEHSLRDLRNQLELERSSAVQQQQAIASHSRDAAKAAFNSELRILLEQVERVRRTDTTSKGAPPLDSWLSKPIGYNLSSQSRSMLQFVPVEAQQAQLLGYCFEVIAQLSAELSATLQRNGEREELSKLNLSDEFGAQEKMEAQRLREKARMDAEDPRNKGRAGAGTNAEGKIGSHLAPMSRLDALRRVEGQYRSNNAPVTAGAGADPATQQLLTQPISAPISVQTHPAIFNYKTVEEACAALTSMHSGILENLASVKSLLARKDAHYQNVKEALTLQLVEKRKREEGRLSILNSLVDRCAFDCCLFISIFCNPRCRGDQLVLHPEVPAQLLHEAPQAAAGQEGRCGRRNHYRSGCSSLVRRARR
jgi:hypothetical protein